MALGQQKRHPKALKRLPGHPHFARIMTSLHNLPSASGFERKHRVDFWDRVSYYNFVQEFMPKRRRRPTGRAWKEAASAFPEVLAALKPDLILAFGKQMHDHLHPLVKEVPVAKLQHPSAGYEYAVWNPVVQGAFETALRCREGKAAAGVALEENARYAAWLKANRAALPAHGMLIAEEEKDLVRAQWAASLAI
jgi:hypothetical protein